MPSLEVRVDAAFEPPLGVVPMPKTLKARAMRVVEAN
jgi:hypothetical protein